MIFLANDAKTVECSVNSDKLDTEVEAMEDCIFRDENGEFRKVQVKTDQWNYNIIKPGEDDYYGFRIVPFSDDRGPETIIYRSANCEDVAPEEILRAIDELRLQPVLMQKK
ncbi:hypothetical protein [Erwinia rhapontici]|uniref:hypothetical protein n=1 Tax=Erwinia rhapontici TaxID=55212 RepID=UPI0013319894|nr:hypothetical protein [Erwinia rhapontici]